MLIISTFSSHKIGMGHFFRSLNLAKKYKKNIILLINKNSKCKKYLKNIKYEFVDYKKKNWEKKYLKKKSIIWINDRLDTESKHVKLLQKSGVFVVSIDDNGGGGKISNLNFAQNIHLATNKKNNFLKKEKYLILKNVNPQKIKIRKKVKSIMVTLGGSDTYNLTNVVIKNLLSLNLKTTVFIGPENKLKNDTIKNKNINYKFSVRNLENHMYYYDLIICGGGITPFNAASQGLPSIIVANEKHEINTAKYLEKMGVGTFCGFRSANINAKLISKLNLEKMSKNGIYKFDNNGIKNFMNKIKIEYKKYKKIN